MYGNQTGRLLRRRDIFGYTWSLVLRKLETYMLEQDLARSLRRRASMPFFEQLNEQTAGDQDYAYIGPTWMDDLALSVGR